MADYLVLEEDGTSHLELEGSAADLLTEESPPPPPPPSSWQVGTFTVPSSPGPVSVVFAAVDYSELDATYSSYDAIVDSDATYADLEEDETEPVRTPSLIVFFGTNFLSEDTAVTTTGMGLFRGMAAPKWDTGAMLQNAACVVATPAGNAHTEEAYAIFQLGSSGDNSDWLYVASVTSFDAGGFTVNFGIGAAGGYKVVYAALTDTDNVGARVGLFDGTTINLGFKAGASLLHGAWFGPVVGGNDRNQEFYGGAAYPTGNQLNWESAGATIGCFPVSTSAQYVNQLALGSPHIGIVTGMHFTGPSLVTSNIVAYPTGSPAAGNTFAIGGDSADGGMVVAWDDEHNRCRQNTPAAAEDGTVTQTGLPFAPVLLLGYTISNEPSGSSTGGRGAIGMSVVTDEFQWCATVDGYSSQGSFQSLQRGFATAVSGSSVHAGTVELTSDGWVLTTEQDDLAPGPVVWHAFGLPPQGAAWIPQIYRRILNH